MSQRHHQKDSSAPQYGSVPSQEDNFNPLRNDPDKTGYNQNYRGNQASSDGGRADRPSRDYIEGSIANSESAFDSPSTEDWPMRGHCAIMSE